MCKRSHNYVARITEIASLSDHLKNVKKINDKDLADGWGHVLLLRPLHRKLSTTLLASCNTSLQYMIFMNKL